MKRLWSMPVFGVALAACNVVLGLDALKNDPDPNLADGGSSSGAEAGPDVGTCTGALPIGATDCPNSEACCQTGPGLTVGGGCLSVGGSNTLCVPRCNATSDCAGGTCCIKNPSSVPPAGQSPVEPGGWCVSPSLASSLNATCMTSDGNGYVCTGNGDVGYVCAPVDSGSPDGGCPAAAGGGSCVVVPACGCPANENCARINGAPEACVAAGSAGALGSCNDVTNCQPGLQCADYVCDPPCNGPCPTPNYDCLTQVHPLADGGTETLGYRVCEPHCNPVAPQTADATHAQCGPGQRCDLNPSLNGGVTYCTSPAGTGTQGTACNTSYDCAAGFVCHRPPGLSLRCVQFCYVGGASCPNGLTCFTQNEFDRAQAIGVCE
jgi:hypothetical protein